MRKRKLGNSGLEVTPLCLGGNVFGWTIDEATSFSVLDALVAGGANFIDTADVYSRWAPNNHGGESETIIGKWLHKSGQRENVIIATKVGMDLGDEQKGLSKKYILRAIDKSLQRLQTDYIDLYQAHIDDKDTPLDETLEAFSELIQAGKVRAIGASNISAVRLTEALTVSRQRDWPSYQSLQPLYNLYDREDYETTLESVCSKNQIGVIPYFSLASGFLTGKYRSEKDLTKSKRGAQVSKYLNAKGMRILAALDQVAKQHKSTPAQIALAWLMSRPSITAPIASATSVAQLQELLAAMTVTLNKEDIALLDEASG